jgi:hypothetical protein
MAACAWFVWGSRFHRILERDFFRWIPSLTELNSGEVLGDHP